jgi:flagellar biosynthesis/type III secretory pathway protein FliH
MTSLIKNSDWLDTSEVRPVDWGGPSGIRTDASLRQSPINPATARLENEIETLRKDLAAAEARHKQDIANKVEQARQEAADAHRRRDEDMLAAFSQALGKASTDALGRLGEAERLALLLCETVLNKLFADASNQKDCLFRAIRRQVEQLRTELIVAVRVSTADFPAPGDLKELRRVLRGQFDIRQDEGLAAGSCRIDLRLGHIDLSLPAYWTALRAELQRLADLEAKA